MLLEDKILEDYKAALKARDSVRVQILSFLRSKLKYEIIEKRKEKLEDMEVIAVIKKHAKSVEDSIAQFRAGGREDLVEKEARELEILKVYLPQSLSADKVKELIEEAVKASGASTPQDMGKVMKELLPRLGGKADNKLVSELVKERLIRR